jgi:hypothetical protein
MPRRARKCLTDVINSHLAHMRIEFSCTAASRIVSVTNAGSSRSWSPMQISVARSRIMPMCVVAAMISLTRRAHCPALSSVYSNGNAAVGESEFPASLREAELGTRSEDPKRRTQSSLSFGNWPSPTGSHLSWLFHTYSRVRPLSTQFEFLTWSHSSCVSWPTSAGSAVSWLSLTWKASGQVGIQQPRVPHVELLEIGQQAECGRKRRELVATDLEKTRLPVRSR